VLQPELKANLFAETFRSQATLPAAAMEAVIGEPSTVMGDFVLIRQRWTRRVLANIDEDKATGPDGIPGAILKRTRRELAAPITRLARRLLTLGAWPDIWRYHWIVPLYKRKSVYNPLHYRGVHLTPVLSNVVEQLISNVLIPLWEKIDAFGNDQWAFRKKHNYKDLVTLLVASWIMAVNIGNKVGIYLSDIAAAFDRVLKQYMLAKCRRAGASDCFLAFLSEFLAPRRASVIVGGVSSDPFTIEDMVFQGTHFGPLLWNIFFADVSGPAASNGAKPTKFADDLNTYKSYPADTALEEVLSDLKRGQQAVHQWGAENRVSFGPGKECRPPSFRSLAGF